MAHEAFKGAGAKTDSGKSEAVASQSTKSETTNRNEAIAQESTKVKETAEDFQRKDAATTVKQKTTTTDQTKSHTVQGTTYQQAAAEVHETTASAQPVKAQDIISQIAEMRNAQPDPTGRVRIVLDPPNLGSVQMDVVVRGDRVSAVMTAENSQVQQILRSHADEMKQALVDSGFRIDRIEIRQSQEKGAEQWQNNNHASDQQSGSRQRQEQPQNKFEMSDIVLDEGQEVSTFI